MSDNNDQQAPKICEESNTKDDNYEQASVEHGGKELSGTQGNDGAIEEQVNELSAVQHQPLLNYDISEKIIKMTVANFPTTRSSLCMVSHFFKDVVDSVAMPKIYMPELANIADLDHVSVRLIISMKGKASSVILQIRQLISSANWANAWLKVRFSGYGWFVIKSIYWKKKPKL